MEKIIVGGDISKDKINFAVMHGNKVVHECEIKNSYATLKSFIKEVQQIAQAQSGSADAAQLCFVMEYTGIYNNILLGCLVETDIDAYVCSGLAIKNASGLIRGKNDKIDAVRIADYGMRHCDKLKKYEPSSEIINQLKIMSTQRSKLVKMKSQLTQDHDDIKKFHSKGMYQMMKQTTAKVKAELEKSINEIEKKMMEIINADEATKANFKFAVSVPGVGKVTAIGLLCYTNNFTSFASSKALGSYCGVVPFEHSSGRYKGKEKVSFMANKKLKTLLHLCAVSSIKTNSIFKEYYIRKTEIEKKNKMLVLNNLRNKILKTVFSCVKNKTKFDREYKYEMAA
jgi:transposase